jgi:hypothetical protein
MRRTSIIGARFGVTALARALAAAALGVGAAARADEIPVAPSWLLGAQATAVAQAHPAVSGPAFNPDLSFGPGAAAGGSVTASVMGGVVPWTDALLVAMPEYANGGGMPNPTGLASYPDGDILHLSRQSTAPYLARLYLQQTFRLGAQADVEREAADPESRFMPAGPLALRRARPPSRLEITAGRLAASDLFDRADAAGDPRHGFMSWALMNDGAWDFPADTRGYTWGVFLSLETPRWAARGGVALMPTRANGPDLDWDVRHHRSEMAEGELRWQALGGSGSMKLLLFVNRAYMASYGDALAAAAPGTPPRPLSAFRQVGAVKVGAGLLVQQRLGPALCFARYGWNDGKTESFTFTEIDRAFSAAVQVEGRAWGRPGDRAGLGLAVSALSPDHAAYLAAGGSGFQLGDGALRYGWETVLEAYYALRLGPLLELTADLQGLKNPGMNADHGPTLVAGLRLHAHLQGG